MIVTNNATPGSFRIADIGAIPQQGTHVFTVDVEEWFQVGAFESVFQAKSWSSLESRVVYQTEKVLALLDELDIKATFFCLGWVAERYPTLISHISDRGHEIGCHGSEHGRLFTMDRGAIENDILNSKKRLEDTSGKAVYGYRAPSFSLTSDVWWVYEFLEEQGFSYSSSLYPVKTDHYGMAEAPRVPFYPLADGAILEMPMTVSDVPLRRLPASGGGYFRLFPYFLSRALLQSGSKQSDAPAVFYMHPWEMDPDQPYVSSAPLLSRFRHYQGQKGLPSKLRALARDFQWNSFASIYAPILEAQ